MACDHCGSDGHQRRYCISWWVERMIQCGAAGTDVTADDAEKLYEAARNLFRVTLLESGYERRGIDAILTKINDAGPRSAPTAAFSKVKPGRPQSGADGNRINRCLLPKDHKQYASKREARLVGVRYILQALSMQNAPEVPGNPLAEAFVWLVGHEVRPGEYLDPVMLLPIDFGELFAEPRSVTSGHLIPLSHDDGFHTIDNTFLQLKKSNDLQGDNAVVELLEMLEGILKRHGRMYHALRACALFCLMQNSAYEIA